MFRRTLKSWLEKGLRLYGYELKEIGAPMRGFAACLEYAKSRGLDPRTVFDIGVGWGTPWLYAAFPAAKIVLVEPLAVFESSVSELSRQLGADVHTVALAPEPGVAEMNANIQHPTSSSLLSLDPQFSRFADVVQRHHRFRSETVRLDTLDGINQYDPPYVLKLDVEGGELNVLKGASETLRRTEFIVMEISVMRRRFGEPDFADIIGFMNAIGFRLFDIPCIAQARNIGQVIYLDAAFVGIGSRLWPGQ